MPWTDALAPIEAHNGTYTKHPDGTSIFAGAVTTHSLERLISLAPPQPTRKR